MMSVWTKFRSALRAFRIAQGGNIAITFVFATLPIIAGVGFAVDYSHANAVKVAMQAALDSTALMLSKEAASDTATQLQTNAINISKRFSRVRKPLTSRLLPATTTRAGLRLS